MAREVGISKIHFFPMVSDEGQGPKYKAPIHIQWAVNLETEEEYKEGEYYADNIIEKQVRSLLAIGITMEVSSNLPPATEVKITGRGYKNGKKFSRVGQNPISGALAYEIQMDDDTVRRRVIYNTALTRTAQNNATSESEEEGQIFTFEGKGIPLVSTKDVELTMDQKEVEALPENTAVLAEWEAFFTKVVMPDGQDTTVTTVAKTIEK